MIAVTKKVGGTLENKDVWETDSRISLLEERRSMGFIQVAQRRFGIAGELISFFARNKRWWMLPMIFVVLLLGVLLILAQSSVIAPFIYTLF